MAPVFERAVVVGAGLAALRGAEAMREAGFAGPLTIVGAEPCRPYDRPPLSKHVLAGTVPAEATTLPSALGPDVDWQLGSPAVGLDRVGRTVRLADGRTLPYDRLLIATGTRARPWPNPHEGRLAGVFTLRGRDDAAALRRALAARPKRVLVIGGGFIGCEVASLCRQLGLPVTLVEPGPTPLARVLGPPSARSSARSTPGRGVELRCGAEVEWLEDADGRLVRAHLVDGSRIEADVAVDRPRRRAQHRVARRVRPVGGSRRDRLRRGRPRRSMRDGRPDRHIAAAGDVARFPHPLYGGRRVVLEHWSHAVAQGVHAGRLLVGAPTERALRRPADLLVDAGRPRGQVRRPDRGRRRGGVTQGDPAVRPLRRRLRPSRALHRGGRRWIRPAGCRPMPSWSPHGHRFRRGDAATDRPKDVAVLEPGFS